MAKDTNVGVGVRGKYFVAMGDSITNGVGDDFSADNDSSDDRNLSRGFTPILNDLLSGELNIPITVMNEGLGGTTSKHGVNRLNSTKARHAKSQYWLILFGTNDSGGSMPFPSGINCTESQLANGDSSCVGTYKYNMRKIIKNLKSAGKKPVLGKVPFADNATDARDARINEYNMVIDDLVTEHNIAVTPPDFYTHFQTHHTAPNDELSDNLHPNGNGYISMAELWFDALIQSGILNP
jgi:lysophospholipase L1-like esterase